MNTFSPGDTLYWWHTNPITNARWSEPMTFREVADDGRLIVRDENGTDWVLRTEELTISPEDDQMITSPADLCELYGVKYDIGDEYRALGGDPLQVLSRGVSNNTECGAGVTIEGNTVAVHAIVEGSDAEFGHTLTFPFTRDEWNETIETIEMQASEAWFEANGWEESE